MNTTQIPIQMPLQMPTQMQPLFPVTLLLILTLNRFLLDVFVNKSDIITFQMEEMGERAPPADLHHQKVCRSKCAKHGTN